MSKQGSEAPEAMERVQETVEPVVEQGKGGAEKSSSTEHDVAEEADDGRRAVVAEDPGPAGAEGAPHEAEGQVDERPHGVGPDGADAQQTTETQEAAVVEGSMSTWKTALGEEAPSAQATGTAEVLPSVQAAAFASASLSAPAEAAATASPSGQMVTCGVVRDLLPLYVDDVVGAETKAMVETHLQTCPGCQGYLDGMRSVVQIPVAPKQRLEDAKVLRALKRFIRNKRLITGLGTAAAVLAACCLAIGIMNSYEWDVPYSDDITVYENRDGFICLQYTGPGHVYFNSSWGDDGVMSVSCQQSFWERYVEPIYDSGMDDFWLAESRDIIEVRYFDTATEMWDVEGEGEVVWEADAQEKRDFYERQRSMEQKSEDLDELYRQMDEIQEQIWDLEADQERYAREIG